MYQLSNRQYNEVIEMLTAYTSIDSRDADLRTKNRFRRARLLLRALSKRKPIEIENIHIINNKNK